MHIYNKIIRRHTMKLSQLRQIIREEFKKLISEGFADPKLAMINKLGGLDRGWKRTFWDAAANTYDLAWDKLPKGTLQKKSVTDKSVLKDGMMTFWVVKTAKDNPYRVGYASYSVRPGVLAVTLGGKIQYYSRSGIGGKDASDKYAGGAVGRGERGQLQIKKIAQLADEVYTFNLGDFRGGTTAMKAKRADLKLGKDTFKDHRAWKQANLKRYKDILDARVGSRDQVDRMVGEIVKIANEAVATGMEVVKIGRYDRLMTTINGNEVEMDAVTSAMSRALQYYANYIRYANSAEKEKKQGYSSNYYDKESKAIAGSLKKILNAFKKGDGNNINRY